MTPDDYNSMDHWQRLPPVDPSADSQYWEQEHIPVCCCDMRKYVSKKNAHIIVSCSGPAVHWSDEPGMHGYGYCEYHWTLREHQQLFSGQVIPNPLYTESDRVRDLHIMEAFWGILEEQGQGNATLFPD